MAGGRRKSEANSIPSNTKVVWVSTRRGGQVADAIAGNVVERYVLQDVLTNGTALFHEFSEADLVVFEVPPVTRPQFEHKMLDVVQKVLNSGPGVMVVVQPSLRRKTNKSLWISKWNMLSHAPFKFSQTCSCRTGNRIPGCHLTCYVGCSGKVTPGPCSEAPTLCTTSQAAVESFGASVQHLIGLAASSELASRGSRANPMGKVERLIPEEAAAKGLLVTDPTLCRSTSVEPQQTPNSAQTRLSDTCHSAQTPSSVPIKQVAFPTDAKERERKHTEKTRRNEGLRR